MQEAKNSREGGRRFALIGASGFVAPRHMRAIKDTGNTLVTLLDPNDSVGVIDSFFPDAKFFIEFERFDRHVDLLRRNQRAIDYVSICSPNYLHDAHIRFALRSEADAICEKPLVLNPWNLDGLLEAEKHSGRKVSTILQLRLHSAIKALKQEVSEQPQDMKHDVDLTYITSRGRWYYVSWKGDVARSGGLATNIGVHFFDMLHYVFGNVHENRVHYSDASTVAGFLEYDRARVRWFLSVDPRNLPTHAIAAGKTTFRSLSMDGKEVEFSGGFTDLHTESYREVLAGRGFGIEENRVAVETVAEIRNLRASGVRGEYHPMLQKFRSSI